MFEPRAGIKVAIGTVAGIAAATPAYASNAARADLLAAEAARFSASAAAGPGGLSSWIWLGVLLLGTSLAAFLGTVYGSRRKIRIDGESKTQREVTFRLNRNEPLHLKSETLGRLAGVLDDLEDIGMNLKGDPETARVAQAIRESAPVEFVRRDDRTRKAEPTPD
ncbi:MAG: hypothetical protein HKN12_02735, partial [Gemmatimonadetes bacterium]|nr:hypothetical protein [Gemmatimonadota bacterium]